MRTIDVIIPVYRPDEKLVRLLERLHRQTCPVHRIILINTERSLFEAFFREGLPARFDKAEVHHISREEFDHGGTRRRAVEYSDAEFFICMTDDAVPADAYLVEKLMEPLLSGKASAAYARQLAGKESDVLERLSRRFNYPPVSRIKTLSDRKELGIKSFFCSNVCAAYVRAEYERLGGFEKHMIFNEDMVYAGKLQDAGGAIAYVADARVYHAHHYSALQQFKRNFDLGVSQAQFPGLFGQLSSQKEGMKLVRIGCGCLLRRGDLYGICKLFWLSAWKLAGYQLGKHYRLLPRPLIRCFTMNRIYWERSLETPRT
ncbi:MAG: glycosyltransferase [Lachnospiraceae bacterium]|nr:glycosyltransferase [Lachnospiraceae bacterium]